MAGDFIAGIFLVALIYMLVKPQSIAGTTVHLFAQAMTALVTTVTTS